jgi:hypothetical protein
MNSHQDVRVAISLPTVTILRSVATVLLPPNVVAPLIRFATLSQFFFCSAKRASTVMPATTTISTCPPPDCEHFSFERSHLLNAAKNIFLIANDYTMRIRSSSDLTDLNDSAPMNCLVGESIELYRKSFIKLYKKKN